MTSRARPVAMLLSMLAAVMACSGPPTTPTSIPGQAVSMRYDPFRVSGLPVTDILSGPKVPLPQRLDRVAYSDGSDIDRLALLAIDDIEQFWSQHYRASLDGSFSPVLSLASIDTTDPNGSGVCGADPPAFEMNAAYCHPSDVIAWDRVDLLPIARNYFGDMAVNGILAHEYGHAVQWQAGLVSEETPILVREQQADCLAGVYLRWVAEGRSSRFALNTTAALDRVIAGAIAMRDPISSFSFFSDAEDGHGTALDRVSALQQGFDVGAHACSQMTLAEIDVRRGALPAELFDPASPASDMTITDDTLATLFDDLDRILDPAEPPALATRAQECQTTVAQPVVYCAPTNTVVVDVAALERIGTPADETHQVLLQGDNTAISMVISRYVLALQRERGLGIDSPVAAMRTACLTGTVQRRMADNGSGIGMSLGAGDLDEAISGLLTSGLTASDVDGFVVPSGFTRITAFRAGLLGDADGCFRRFQ